MNYKYIYIPLLIVAGAIALYAFTGSGSSIEKGFYNEKPKSTVSISVNEIKDIGDNYTWDRDKIVIYISDKNITTADAIGILITELQSISEQGYLPETIVIDSLETKKF